MPIIDPSFQCFLIKKIGEIEEKDGHCFFLKYLKVASKNINRNLATIEASIQFKKDFEQSIATINEEFRCNITDAQIKRDNFQRNCYKYLYKHIKIANKEELTKKYQGLYKICNDKFNTRFFEPYILYSKFHSWHLSDTPIAILSINSENFTQLKDNEEMKSKILHIIKLEIDLLSASGLSLVLCLNYAPILNEFLVHIIKDDQFSEIHCNIFNDDHKKPFLKLIKKNFQNNFHFLRGYFYLYCHFAIKNTEEQIIMKEIKKKTHLFLFKFSKAPDESLLNHEFIPTKPFFHYKTGFESKYLRMFVSYIPLFDKETEEESFIPSDVSSISQIYINPADFLRMTQKRVKLLIEDEKTYHCIVKYANFEDIHSVRTEFFVKDGLLLTKMEEGEISIITKIKENVDAKTKTNEEFHRDYLFNLLNMKKYQDCLQYVSYAYSQFIKSSIPDFSLHRAQIYAAFEACKTCFSVKKDRNGKQSKGVIYQVETGEGKSCIVCLIAAVLAIKKYTVHIASSNIKLSNRDYYNSYYFFKSLGLTSAVLLHKNELPFKINKENKQEESNEEEDGNSNKKEIPMKYLSQFEEDNYFKGKSNNYFELNTKENNEAYQKNYPDDFFGEKLYDNPSRMNFSVCGIDNDNNESKNKANVIFSTFVNFECFYLHLMEMCPGYIDKYYKKCGLLIDEADSILIDEIKNGTIISREIKSNAKEILTFVYKQKINYKTAEETYNKLKENPMCSDLILTDVEDMYKDIDLVFSDEYSNGRKYYVDTFEVRNNHRIRNLIKKTINNIMDIPDKLAKFVESKMLKMDNDDDEGDEEEDDEFDTRYAKKFKQIIPFDYSHKGILEPNKEFSGFVQQFISIKESLTNEDVVFKDISMSYLYISHPIFANLYPKICGFTGTIGSSSDKEIYEKHYNLITKKVPRNKPSRLVIFPTIVCNTIEERNKIIVTEVIEFHRREQPVIVIFQDLNEIEIIQEMLFERGIHFINIFNGKDEYILPDMIAGIKGSVSLGTNICGRGTDIRLSKLPLHVIVSYYSSNIRVMKQAFGRTARQGRKGTCRCVCLKEQILTKFGLYNVERTQKAVDEFEYKIEAQQKFIEHYKETRPWIFNFNIEKQKIPEKYIERMRKARINVNRIVSYKYKFPVCMSINTFLKIQSQKIFSLFNCPNSKYTWRLFQRHIREMILESWSLMIHNFEQFYKKQNKTQNYKDFLDKHIELLHNSLEEYLPKRHYNIVPTFMHIHKIVIHKYQPTVLNSLKNFRKAYISFGKTSFAHYQLGFKPYSLLSRSGARINFSNIGETNYIEDPELKYQQKMPDNTFTFLSITERIDMIFNKIFQKISETIGEKIYLKFFLRRTLAGCEFGLCLDINLINSSEDFNEKYYLIDKDPLLVFTIFLWSTTPIMAGILIYVLVYVTGLTKNIISWASGFPEKITEEVIKQGVVSAVKLIVPNVADFFIERICSYLEKVLDNQIAKLLEKDKNILEELKRIFLSREFEKAGELLSDKISSFSKKISDFLGGFIKIPEKLKNIFTDSINGSLLMKIGFLILLCLGTYIKSFMQHKKAIENAKSNAKTYDSTFDHQKVKKKKKKSIESSEENQKSEKSLNNIIKNEKMEYELDEIPKLDKNKEDLLKQGYDKISKTYIFKFKTLILSKYNVKSSDYINDKSKRPLDSEIKIYFVHHKSTKVKYINCTYNNKGIDFTNSIRLHIMSVHPVISPFGGYFIKSNKINILIKYQEKGFLNDYLNKSTPYQLNSTEKLIISYGIACALEYLHSHKIIIREIKPEKIMLDSNFYPYLFNFYTATNIDSGDDEIIRQTTAMYMSPEFLQDPEKYSETLPVDVYAYAITLFQIFFNDCPLFHMSNMKIVKYIMEGERPEFPDSAPSSWKNLIERCWDQDPNKRPTFTEICDKLESNIFVDSSINVKDFINYMEIVKPFRP